MKNKKFSNEEVIYIEENGIGYLKFKALEKYKDKIMCIVTLRHGGKSKGCLESLNFRMSGKDDKENVLENLDLLCKTLKIENSVYKATQNHTNNILYLTEQNKEKYLFQKENPENFDGYIVGKKDMTTMITTADCNAIVIYDTKNNKYSSVHSGWRGTTLKIYIKAIEKMEEEFNSKPEDLIVCVSPAVLKCCFSSEDENFKKIFTSIWEDEKNYIYYETNKKRFHIDLSYVIKKDLLAKGVKKENIHFAGICTCCNNKDFYSYRVKTMRNEDDYGCMATLVKLL